ncbi:MAG: hypothetical protein ACRDID_11445, partial [Ktedonobacterales bacterium]
MPENQDTLLPPRRTSRTRKVAAPTGAETVAETTMQTSALSTNSINPAADQMGSQSVTPRVSRARRSAAPAATDDTTSAPAVTQPSETPAAPTRRRA